MAARRVGVCIGIIFLALAFLPKLMAVLMAIPSPVAAAYLTVLVSRQAAVLAVWRGEESDVEGGGCCLFVLVRQPVGRAVNEAFSVVVPASHPLFDHVIGRTLALINFLPQSLKIDGLIFSGLVAVVLSL